VLCHIRQHKSIKNNANKESPRTFAAVAYTTIVPMDDSDNPELALDDYYTPESKSVEYEDHIFHLVKTLTSNTIIWRICKTFWTHITFVMSL
jgi:hypothetical protein